MAEYYKKKQPSCTTPDGREWFASGGGNTNPEYIEREALLEKCGWYNTVNGKSVCAVRKDELASIPAADVAPVVHGRWVHPKGYVVSNGFVCSKCGHEEASHYPINPRPGGCCVADEHGNFFHPPNINYCPNCGADMRGAENE